MDLDFTDVLPELRQAKNQFMLITYIKPFIQRSLVLLKDNKGKVIKSINLNNFYSMFMKVEDSNKAIPIYYMQQDKIDFSSILH